jgi:hypothetical protein
MPFLAEREKSTTDAPPAERVGLGHSTPLYVIVVGATVLYAVWFAVHYRAVYDPDIWWHLRAGYWVLNNHAVPQTEWLSTTAAGKPWVLYSWGFDALVAALYRAFGLFGPIVVYPVTMVLLIAMPLWALLNELGMEFWTRVLVAAGALVAMAPIFSPRPGLFSVFFFTLELWLIVRAERSESRTPLYFLPLLFAIWANVHIQFIYGLFALGVYAAEPWIEKTIPSKAGDAGSSPQPRFLAALGMTRLGNGDRVGGQTSLERFAILGVCAVATLVNPYTYRVYEVIVGLATQGGQYSYISELQSPTFRTYNSFAELFLILAAWFVLGSKAHRRWLSTILLVVATVFAFRAVRDVWFGVLVCVFVIGQSVRTRTASESRRNSFAIAVTAAIVLFGVLVILNTHPVRNVELWQDTAEEFPVKAVEYVKQHNLQGPLYNDWYWGGFLTWSLPDDPVYVDSRTNVYGDQVLQRSISTWSGASDWANDPAVSNAKLVIANPDNPLTSLLRFDPRFRTAYEDSRAVVFVAPK